MIPVEKWWGIICEYGSSIWPAQLISITIAIALVIYLFVTPGKNANLLMKIYLSFSFAWIGIIFFIIQGKGLAGNYFFGILFTVVAILFVLDIYRKKMEFCVPKAEWQKYLTIFLMLVVLCYPLFGMAFGHYFPKLIIIGTHPCPTAAFALLLLTTAVPRVNRIIYGILLFWAVPFPIFIQIPKFGVYEDSIMLVIGIYSLIMLIKNWKLTGKDKNRG
ncbi:MAG: hypothetical protein JRJ11_03745 [Deltaproteobacteria bacterium]|nr:hypothetical protein [Deltaproteobacteria bacterium]MBW1908639.1 hypothetical protein [Deltaproteobacteria bacterium]MBW2115256.1 hypothetical protein [Deltaproteobacteria bacterium]